MQVGERQQGSRPAELRATESGMNRAPDRVQSRSGARGQGTARLRNTPALGGEHRDADAALGPGSSANRADGAEAATLGTGVSEDHPTARVPAELTTEPKEYQLQVSDSLTHMSVLLRITHTL